MRPHPHIGLATVIYLFEGAMLHRDSLGSVQRIEPVDIYVPGCPRTAKTILGLLDPRQAIALRTDGSLDDFATCRRLEMLAIAALLVPVRLVLVFHCFLEIGRAHV